MEFKFPAVEDRPPPIYSPSPGPVNFSDHPFRDPYCLSSHSHEIYPHAPGGYLISPNVETIHYRESLQRELEKARIREEIIEMEMSRRRMMEAEARRLMVLRGAAPNFGLPFEGRSAMRFDQRFSFTPHPFDGRFIEDHPSAFPGHGSFNMLPPPPLQQRWPEPTAYDPKPEARKDKIIFLPKPQPQLDLSGRKRKAVTPPPVPAESKKKPKEEWSCALCQVSATNNKGLNQHLKGKKHKGREARLQAEKAAKHSNREQLPKKTSKPKPAGDIESAKVEPGVKSVTDSFPFETKDKCFGQKIKDPEENKGEELSLQKSQNADHTKKDGVAGKAITNIGKKGNFKSWCETCKIGAHSEKVMKTHKKGKKHMARLKKLCLSEAVAASTATPATTQEEKDADDATEANEKQADNVTSDANTPDKPPAC